MEDLGKYLKTAREAKGVTLRELADRTRISMTFLQALEDGNFSVIPGEVFVSGFLRVYAKELGLKEKEVMKRYKESGWAQKMAEEEEAPQMPQALPSQADKKAVKISPKILYVAAAAVLLTIAAYFMAGGHESVNQPVQTAAPAVQTKGEPVETPVTEAPATATETTGQPSPSAAVKPAETTVQKTAPPAAESKPAPPAKPEEIPAPAASRLTLTIKANSLTWFLLKIDGTRSIDGILKEGESATYEADSEMLLDLGNAGGVQLTYNGKALPSFGPEGAAIKNILFTKDKPGVVTEPAKKSVSGTPSVQP